MGEKPYRPERHKSRIVLSAGVAFFLAGTPAMAVPFDLVRVGDRDGFGFAPAGLVRATAAPHTTPADTNGNGVLEPGEFLPDLNQNSAVATGNGDDFDNRSAAEVANTGPLGGSGFTDLGSSGFKWTDISLSTSFTGPNFPDPGGAGVPNQPQLIFQFHVAGSDILTGQSLFFNVVFGDYDVFPANITLTFASSPQRTIALITQGGLDGLVQAASTFLNFGEVFSTDGIGGWNGFLQVDFIAPNEPYTAFDFTELSTRALVPRVPEPGSFLLFVTGIAGLAFARRQLRKVQRRA